MDYFPFGKVLLGLDEQKRDAYDVVLPVYSQQDLFLHASDIFGIATFHIHRGSSSTSQTLAKYPGLSH